MKINEIMITLNQCRRIGWFPPLHVLNVLLSFLLGQWASQLVLLQPLFWFAKRWYCFEGWWICSMRSFLHTGELTFYFGVIILYDCNIGCHFLFKSEIQREKRKFFFFWKWLNNYLINYGERFINWEKEWIYPLVMRDASFSAMFGLMIWMLCHAVSCLISPFGCLMSSFVARGKLQ